jgi:hypothetical protein
VKVDGVQTEGELYQTVLGAFHDSISVAGTETTAEAGTVAITELGTLSGTLDQLITTALVEAIGSTEFSMETWT